MARTTTDHEEIRRWVETHGGHPARVKRTGGKGDPGVLRIDFPGFSGARTLEEIPWEAFFDSFEANQLAFLYEDQDGSRFNKIIGRDTAEARARGEHVSRHRPASRRRLSRHAPSREFRSSRAAATAKRATAKTRAKRGSAAKPGKRAAARSTRPASARSIRSNRRDRPAASSRSRTG